MKSIITLIVCIILCSSIGHSQSINWSNTDTNSTHMTYLSIGYDYGVTTQVGYGYQLKKDWPLWAQVDISIPMGSALFDDTKTRLGVQLKAFSFNNFAVITRIHVNYRTYQNSFVGMKSFGSEASVATGWYGSRWLFELEAGFDKAITTQLNHTDKFKESYASVQDGWYHNTGGNWFYGIKAGRTFGTNLIASIELGVTNAQGPGPNALLPRYFGLGIVKPF